MQCIFTCIFIKQGHDTVQFVVDMQRTHQHYLIRLAFCYASWPYYPAVIDRVRPSVTIVRIRNVAACLGLVWVLSHDPISLPDGGCKVWG